MSDLGNKEIMAKNIRRYMDEKNKDRKQICSDLGFKYSTFTDWINGNKYPRIDKIEMMANYFGVNKSNLVEATTKETHTKRTIEQKMTDILDELTSESSIYYHEGKLMSQEEKQLLRITIENTKRMADEMLKRNNASDE